MRPPPGQKAKILVKLIEETEEVIRKIKSHKISLKIVKIRNNRINENNNNLLNARIDY